jgi:hypothetical protein
VILLDNLARNAVAQSVATATEFKPYRELNTPKRMADFCRDHALPEQFARGGNYDGLIALWCLERDITEFQQTRLMEALR